MSYSLRPHRLQQVRLPCPSPSPTVCSDSCSLSWWYHPTISSSVIPFSSCLQSFSASGSFLVNQLFASGGQSIGASVSASVLPMNSWFPLGWTGWISSQSKGLKSLLQHHSSKASILWQSVFFMIQFSCQYMTTGKIIALSIRTFVCKVMSLLSNMLSRFVIAFLPRSKHLLISWLQSLAAVILEPEKIKFYHYLHCFKVCHLFAMKWWYRMPWSLFFECWVLSELFPLSSFTLIKTYPKW